MSSPLEHLHHEPLAITLLGVLALLCVLPVVTAGQEDRERIIEKKSDFNPPVKITLVKTKKGVVETGKKFLDDDEDWFKGLTVRVTNTSNKPVIYVDVEVLFSRPEGQTKESPYGTHLQYGRINKWPEKLDPLRAKPVPPGGAIEIAISATDFDHLKSSLRELGYPPSLKGIEVRVIEVGFDDDTLWSVGHTWRRDPKAPRGWSPLEEQIGSARKRAANFFGKAIEMFDAELERNYLRPSETARW